MRLSITPAPRGNTASPSRGGDTTFKRGESLAGIVVSSPEACSAQDRLVVLISQATGGKASCSVKSFFFFFFQNSTQSFGLFSNAAESHCGFSCLVSNRKLAV